VAGDPGLEELAGLVRPPLLLVEEGTIVVVLLRAGDELLERLGAVLGKGELFVERGFHGFLSEVLAKIPLGEEIRRESFRNCGGGYTSGVIADLTCPVCAPARGVAIDVQRVLRTLR
jgi:hypothetical protein